MTSSLNSPRAAGKLHVGVDLGTAYTVILAVDEAGQPVAGEYQFAQIVRDYAQKRDF